MFKNSLFLSALMLLGACSGRGKYLDDVEDIRRQNQAQPPVQTPFSGKVSGNVVDISPIVGQRLNDKTIARPSALEQDLINRAVRATNELRTEQGLPALQIDETLSAYAILRAQEIYSSFSHYRLDSSHALFHTYFTGSGTTGENLANGKNPPETIVKESLRKSATHYQNMIYPHFTHIGIGVYFDDLTKRYYWAQIFASQNVDSVYSLGDVGGLSASRLQRALYDYSNHRNQRLNLTAPEKNPNAYQNNLSALYGQTAYVIELEGNRQIVMNKNDQWQYQSIGEVLENQKTLAYLNLGSAFTPSAQTDFTASYTGKALGDVAQRDRVLADMSATVNFTGADKYMILNIANAQKNGVVAPEYNLNQRLNWNGNEALFRADADNFARLYGRNAEEIGGQFKKEINGETYRGVYGGKR